MCNSHYTIILIVWWLLFIIRCVSDNTNLRLNCIALGLFTVFICIDCVFQVQTELSRLSYDDVDTFNEYYESTDKAIQQVKAKDDGFYRLEKTFLHGNGEQIYNDSYLFNYNGISCFSSTTKDELKSFMGRLGYRRNFLKIVYDGGSTEFVDINELIANILSWIIAVMFAFLTNRVWIFQSPTNGVAEFVKQMLVFYSGRVITLVVE